MTTDTTFLQEIALGILDIVLNGASTAINFFFSLLSALVSSVLAQNGLNVGGLFGS